MLPRRQGQYQGPDIPLPPSHEGSIVSLPCTKLLAAANDLQAITKAHMVVGGYLHQRSLVLLQQLQVLLRELGPCCCRGCFDGSLQITKDRVLAADEASSHSLDS